MMRKFLLFLVMFICCANIVNAQATSITVGGNLSNLSVSYNTINVVDSGLTITAIGNITGFRVQI